MPVTDLKKCLLECVDDDGHVSSGFFWGNHWANFCAHNFNNGDDLNTFAFRIGTEDTLIETHPGRTAWRTDIFAKPTWTGDYAIVQLGDPAPYANGKLAPREITDKLKATKTESFVGMSEGPLQQNQTAILCVRWDNVIRQIPVRVAEVQAEFVWFFVTLLGYLHEYNGIPARHVWRSDFRRRQGKQAYFDPAVGHAY